MADIQIQRIKSALHKLFDGNIGMSDYDGKPPEEEESAFLSRALAAYALSLLCDVDGATAASALTDGFDDNGLDIPLESTRLGFHTLTNEYNPVACSILEATVDYPFRFGKGLVDKSQKWLKAWIKRVPENISPSSR